jgi:hypothetical protein
MLPIGRFMPNPAAENKVLPDWLWPIDGSSHRIIIIYPWLAAASAGERVRTKFFGWFRRKQKERRVQNAGISPEAVSRKGHEERNKE